MGYTSKDPNGPRGEICLKGPSIFVGYYKETDKFKEVIDNENWFHTGIRVIFLIIGDIGTFDKDGRLKIIDRKKNLFKLQ